MKVSSIMEIFSNPSTYDLYSIALGALDNWKDFNDEARQGKAKLEEGNCLDGGRVYGKIMRKVIESDASLTGLVWGGLGAAADAVGQAVSGATSAVAGAAGDAASYASDSVGSAYASVKGWWGSNDEL